MIINQKRLRHFYAVYTHGKIREAAESLCTDSSVVTRQIKILEEEIGYMLFERQPRGVVPTEAAQGVLEYYLETSASLDKLETKLQELCNIQRGNIHLAIPDGHIDVLMEEVLNDFCNEYTEVNICIEEVHSSSQVVTRLLENNAHIGLTFGVAKDPDIRCHARAPLPIHMLVGKNHAFADQQKITFSETSHYPLALPPASFSLWKMLQTVEHSENIKLKSQFTSNSASALKEFASTSCGGTFMSTSEARQEIKSGQLIALEIDHPVFMSTELCLAVRRGRPLLPATNQLLRVLTAKLPNICA